MAAIPFTAKYAVVVSPSGSTTGSTGLLDLDLNFGNVTTVGQNIQYVGSGQVDAVFLRPGVSVDFTASGAGIDKLYLEGEFADYTCKLSGKFVVLTRTDKVSGLTESATVAAGDSLVFADGSISTADLIARVKNKVTTAPLLGDETSGSPTVSIEVTPTVTMTALRKTGVTFAQGMEGAALKVVGSAGVDTVYVKANTEVDVTGLGAGQDVIYFTGNYGEYEKTVTTVNGKATALVFTRTSNNAVAEKITLATTGDKAVFADGSALTDDIAKVVGGNGSTLTSWKDTETTPTEYTDIQAITFDALRSSRATNGTFKVGDALVFNVKFKQAVEVSGTPALALNLGGQTVYAEYDGTLVGSSKTDLKFTYVVYKGDLDSNGVSIAQGTAETGAIDFNSGGSINLAGTSTSARLIQSPALNDVAAAKVDGVAPIVTDSYDVAENTATDKALKSITLGAEEAVTWSELTGADAAAFTLGTGKSAGKLFFKSVTNFEAKSSYNVTVTGTDAVGNKTTQDLTIRLNDINEAPVVAAPLVNQVFAVGSVANSYTIPSTAFKDVDAGDELTYTVKLANGKDLPDWLEWNPATSTFAVKAGSTLTAKTAPITVRVTATDGQLSAYSDFTISWRDAPMVQSLVVTDGNNLNGDKLGKEGESLTLALTLSQAVTSTQGLTATFNVGGKNVTANLNMVTEPTNTLVFTTQVPEGANGATSLKSLVADNKGKIQSADGVALLAPAPGAIADAKYLVDTQAPTINSTYSVAENTAADTKPKRITLVANEAVTWSGLSGEHASDFTLGTTGNDAGKLLFNGAANFEAKNNYKVTVTGTDAAGNAKSQDITINLTNVNEAPVAVAPMANQVFVIGAVNKYQIPGTTFVDVDAGDTLSYTATLADGSPLPTWLKFDAVTRTFSGTPPADAASEPLSIQVTVSDGIASVNGAFSIQLSASVSSGAPGASTLVSEAPKVYDQGALNGAKADTLMVRFSEAVDVDLLQQAMAQGKISLQGADGQTRQLGAGAVFEAYTPSQIEVSGLSTDANGTYVSLWRSDTNSNSEVPSFGSGFGLSDPSKFAVNTATSIYKKTNGDGSVWYIWQQTGWRTWIISKDSLVDQNDTPQPWYISSSGNSTDPSLRTGVLGVSGWSAKTGALTAGADPWANVSRIASADLEPNGWARTFVLALGSGNTAQGGDTLVIDRNFVKDTTNVLAQADVGFSLPADIVRPTASTSTLATVQGFAADGITAKTKPLVAGDIVRVTLTLGEAVTVSTNSTPSVTLLLDTASRQATFNRTRSYADAPNTTQLVFDYKVQNGDSDLAGGVAVGAFNRNNANVYDLSGNRMSPPSDIVEASNTVSIRADSTAPSLLSITSADKGVIAGTTSDTFTFKFNEPVHVDTLEAALTQGLIKITNADGSSVRNLGDGARVECAYPSTFSVSGFNASANGSYTSLWNPSLGKNTVVPAFKGFSTSGTALNPGADSPIYKHTDSTGQDWYFWRPAGWSNYVLTPLASDINGVAQPWWASGNGSGTGTSAVPREGVLLAGEWYDNLGKLSSAQSMWTSKLPTQPALEASGYGFTFAVALGTGHTVAANDKLVITKTAVLDASGNAPSDDLSLPLPSDITRPTFGTATLKGLTWNDTTQDYVEKNGTLDQGDIIRIELPTSETLKVYQTGGGRSSVALDMDGITKYAYLNLAATVGSTDKYMTTSNGQVTDKLVFDYTVQSGDSDKAGGITLGAFNRNNTGFYDFSGNRCVIPADVSETANTLSVLDTQGPSLWLSYAQGNKVVIQSSDDLDAAHLPSLSAFAVKVGVAAVSVQSLEVLSTNKRVLVLTLEQSVTAGQDVTVNYTDPTDQNDDNAVQDTLGNDAQSIHNYSVTASAAPTIQYAQALTDTIEVAGESWLRFGVKFSDVVRVSGTPRLALTLKNGGAAGTTVYADYAPYDNVSGGVNTLEFVYKPAAGVQGQVHVDGLDLNGGSITAYDSLGLTVANTTLTGSEFFTPYPWIYASALSTNTGDSNNNLLAPWLKSPEKTPHTLTSSTALGNLGDRDVLAMTVLLPSTVQTPEAAASYTLAYNVTADGTRQVLLKTGATVVDTYTVPTDAVWPKGVEQLLFHAVYKDSTGQVQMTDGIDHVLLTLNRTEYVDPVNAKDRWLQGTLGNDTLDASASDVTDRIFLEGAQGNDTLLGHTGVDILRGGGGTNTLSAGDGNDIAIIGRGNDAIDGGQGIDTLRFDMPGEEKKVTLDASGVLHVYSANGNWNDGFVPDANGWVERYRLSSDYGSDGANRLAVFDVALGRNVATVKNMEQIQWRLNDNFGSRATNALRVGTNESDALTGGDVVLAGNGDDTITLQNNTLHTDDWRNGGRPLLVDGGAGRDMLVLDTPVSGSLAYAFAWGDFNNGSRVLKNIEGLELKQGGYLQIAAADISHLYAPGANTNAWSSISGVGAGKQQFLVAGSSGSIELSDATGWTRKNSTVSNNGQTYTVFDHTSGVELLVDSRINTFGHGIVNEGTGPSGTSLSISSGTQNGSIAEGNSGTTPVTFTVARSGDLSSTTTVNWQLVHNGTDSTDFASGQATSGTLSFAPNETYQTIAVQVQGDTTAEANETFTVSMSNPSGGATLSNSQTQVVITNDDGEYVGTGPAPKVTLVRTDTGPFVGPYDKLVFVVEMDQTVHVQGAPRLSLTLTDPTGAQAARTVYADFQPYSDAVNGTWTHQSTLEFAYMFITPDQVGTGWTYHINGLENVNGSSIKSVESASQNVVADLTLNGVAITPGTWLYTSNIGGTTGTANNDLIDAFDAATGNVPHSLTTTSVDGGAGDRDVLSIPVLLPASVTTQAQASSYYLSYEVPLDGNGAPTARYLKVYQTGNPTAVDSYTLPLNGSAWPTNVECLGYYLQYKNANNQIQDTDHPNDHLIFWKSGYTSTDAINGDIMRQGSYLNDSLDLSATLSAKRVLVRGNQGNDTITGHDGTDAINGDGGNDTVNAGAGNDMVFLSAGVDALDGGSGIDILAVSAKGQEAIPQFSTAGKLQLLSAYGNWSNGFTPDNNGFQLDWTFDFNGQTGAIMAQRAGSNETSTAIGFEKIRIYKDLYQVVRGETTDTFDILLGTSGNDTLDTTNTQGILNGLDGDDTLNIVTMGKPVLMGGNGNDTFVFFAAALSDVNGNGGDALLLSGGTGVDTLKLGADVVGENLSQPPQNSGTQIQSIEMFDITGSIAQGAAGNSVAMTAQWLRDLTDVSTTRSFTLKGDANDSVNLLNADNWQLQANTDVAGYALYQTTANNETLKLYVSTAIQNAGHVVMG